MRARPCKHQRRNRGSASGCRDAALHERENMGPVEAAARSPVPGAALGDLPSSRAARAGGRAGRTAYKHPSSLAGSFLRSQCSFRRVFSGTAHEITPALRLARPKRVRAQLDPFAYFKHGEWRHLPTLARPTTRTILRVRKTKPAHVELLDLSKDRGARARSALS